MATRKEDSRITKTKKALSEAFFKMLTEMPLEDITVNDLCTRADIRRATFYKHFKDKSDFVFCLIRETRARFDLQGNEYGNTVTEIKEYYLKCAEAVMGYILKYEPTIKSVLTSNMRPTFIELFVRQNYEDTVIRLEKGEASGLSLFTTPDVIASMLIGGVAHTIVRWYESEDRCPKEKLLGDISEFIDRIL